MKFSLLLCLAGFCLAVSCAEPNTVLRFKPYHHNTQDVLALLNKPSQDNLGLFRKWILDHSKGLTSFKWADCGNGSSTLKFLALSLSPDPVTLPGTITVGFTIDITEDCEDGLAGSVELFKKIESSYIKIPCIGNIGSCNYDDLCGLMAQIPQCPQPFIDNNIPCKCPFKKNSYKMPASQIDINAAVIPPGDYKATLQFQHKGAFAGCLQIAISFA